MKTILTSPAKVFAPVSIALVFETQAELDAFGSLINFSPVLDSLREIGGGAPDYQVFQEAGANIDGVMKIGEAMKEKRFFSN